MWTNSQDILDLVTLPKKSLMENFSFGAVEALRNYSYRIYWVKSDYWSDPSGSHQRIEKHMNCKANL